MRASFEWLCELSGLREITPDQAAEALTMAGWAVEDIHVIDLSPIVVGRVISQRPHPSSRTPQWIHEVDLGDGQMRQIVAGVGNAVAGSLVPVALPGTTVHTGLVVGEKPIAGFKSEGMLCAEDELGLGEDHTAIVILDEGRPGQRLDELIPSDAILDVEVTPNRPDCLSHLGLARELAASLGRALPRDFMPTFTGGVLPPGKDLVSVAIEAPDLCRRYIGAVVTGVEVGPSPRWMQRRIRAAGLRPINSVVDVTNYVLLEYGQPLHAFDLARLSGPQIRVRRAVEGEELLCLDGELRRLDPQMLVIADQERPVALAGVIGGENSAVGPGTQDVLLEAATFDGVNVRSTTRAIRLRTEASSRFEKGLSPELALAGARRAATLLAEVAGGSVHVDWADRYPRPQEPVRVRFRPEQIDRLLGAHVPLEEMEAILQRLEFQVRVEPDGEWDVLPPVYRLDIAITADVAEEVGRIFGYDKVPATLPGSRRRRWVVPTRTPDQRMDPVRMVLAGAGYSEVVTSALVSGSRLARLGTGERAVRVLNPISDDQDALRTTVLPSLLDVAAVNRSRGRPGVAIFEVARVYLRRADRPEGQPEEPDRLAVLRTGVPGPDGGREAFSALKGVLERAAKAVTAETFSYERVASPLFHPGRCARIVIGGRVAGHLGELHPEVTAQWDLGGRAVALEIDVAPLLEDGGQRRFRPLPRYPAISRDLAVVVPELLPAAELLATIAAAGGPLLEEARPFDDYRGAQVPAGHKSVAFSLTFRSPERTLTDAEVEPLLDRIRSALRERHDASFRD